MVLVKLIRSILKGILGFETSLMRMEIKRCRLKKHILSRLPLKQLTVSADKPANLEFKCCVAYADGNVL